MPLPLCSPVDVPCRKPLKVGSHPTKPSRQPWTELVPLQSYSCLGRRKDHPAHQCSYSSCRQVSQLSMQEANPALQCAYCCAVVNYNQPG